MGLSQTATFWSEVKAAVRAAIAGVFREEEAVGVSDGSVTVRPYGEEDTEELRVLAGAAVQPHDRVLVLRLPGLRLVLGVPTVRGVPERALAIPYGGWGGHFGVQPAAARVDHTHSTEDIQPVAQVWNTLIPFTTTDIADYTNGVIGQQVVTLGPGVWSYNLFAEATLWRDVAGGEVYLRLDIENPGTRTQMQTMERNTPVTAANDKDAIRLPMKNHALIALPTGGDVTITVKVRGAGTAGVTSAKMVALSGELWRVG